MSQVLLDIALVLVFILLAAVFVASEIALVSLRASQVRQLETRGRRGARLGVLVSDPNRFLATVQIGVTVLSFLSAAYGADRLGTYVVPLLVGWGLGTGVAEVVSLLVLTLIVSYVSLVIGELVPKRLALQRSERVALVVAPGLDRLASFLRPVIWLLSKSTDVVVRLVGADPSAGREEISGEELRSLVAASESLSRDERALIDEVFDAGRRAVSEVMLPRTEVTFLEATTTVSRAARVARQEPHSRYPIVGTTQDDVVGFVHIRDLLQPTHPAGRSATLADVAREVLRIPGSKKVLAALSEMRREGHHLAIVVDEYGGTDGIVTLEDLIEEIVGEIRDEFDEAEPVTDRGPAGEHRVELDGLCNLDEFAELTGVRLPPGPYQTAAGFVLAQLGRLARESDTVDVVGAGVRITVIAMDERRIARLRVTRIAEDTRERAESAQAGPGGGAGGRETTRGAAWGREATRDATGVGGRARTDRPEPAGSDSAG